MKHQASRSNHRALITVLVLIVLLVGAVVLIKYTHKSPVATSSLTTSDTSSPTTSPTTTASTSSSGGTSGTGSSTSASSTTAPLPVSPNGSFVSSYQVGVDQEEQSTCNTTVGATCTIVFTSGDVTKSLTPTVVTTSDSAKDDNSGASFASWTWQPSTIGLTPGSWTVTATATLNGQSLSTKSNQLLEVSP